MGVTWAGSAYGVKARVVICNFEGVPPVLKVRSETHQSDFVLTSEVARDLLPRFEDLVEALKEIAAL